MEEEQPDQCKGEAEEQAADTT